MWATAIVAVTTTLARGQSCPPASWVWAGLPPAPSGSVNALATMPNGDLIAGGTFASVGTLTCNLIARWNGTAWSTLGTGIAGGWSPSVTSLAVLPNGDLIAAGIFATAGGVASANIARWDGAAWRSMGGGMNGTRVTALAVLPNGDLVASGDFTLAGGVPCNRIARWNGSSWSPVGGGMNNTVWGMGAMPDGSLIASGTFTAAGGVACQHVAKWNGSAWSPLGSGIDGIGYVFAALPGNRMLMAGEFLTAGGTIVRNAAVWDGASWAPFTTLAFSGNITGRIESIVVTPNGHVIFGGGFTHLGADRVNYIVKWNGSAWSKLFGHSTFYGANASIAAMLLRPNGDLLVGGNFTTTGGGSSRYLGLYSEPRPPQVFTHPNNRVVIGGDSAGFLITASPDTTSYRWHHDGVPLLNDGRIFGADTTYLVIDDVTPDDAGLYTCVAYNACGSVTSNPAILEVGCPADFNLDGGVDGADVDAFFAAWEAGDSAADINRDGGIDGSDVSYFFFRWENGC